MGGRDRYLYGDGLALGLIGSSNLDQPIKGLFDRGRGEVGFGHHAEDQGGVVEVDLGGRGSNGLGGWVEEEKAVGMSFWTLMGGWMGGWFDGGGGGGRTIVVSRLDQARIKEATKPNRPRRKRPIATNSI